MTSLPIWHDDVYLPPVYCLMGPLISDWQYSSCLLSQPPHHYLDACLSTCDHLKKTTTKIVKTVSNLFQTNFAMRKPDLQFNILYIHVHAKYTCKHVYTIHVNTINANMYIVYTGTRKVWIAWLENLLSDQHHWLEACAYLGVMSHENHSSSFESSLSVCLSRTYQIASTVVP